ncbi:Phosphonate ABC transporter permease protein phnE2 [Fructilactobacillus florum 8D]|uniref:Phosphonate ABC transporter permease protein phnE2 n=1 Tax=Fructilactobacillus florum 8D TaxID=1221538 RepID=W9EME6_9LACO|nr:phosphonate ABC transporter, permease protein PhnE [Fructilactobacillus florum]ETO40844.1 Phosphonate ABC transporter permease protein phnE2 [Fructilactobacillus florum 8D]
MQVPQLSFWKRYHVLGISVTLLLGLLTVISAQLTGVDVGAFAKNSPQFLVILKQMQQPDWNYLSQIQKPLAQTIQMAVLGTTLGTILAVPFAFLAARNIIKNWWGRSLVRLGLSLIRTLPNLLLAALFVAIFGIGPMTGMITLAIFSFGMVSKLFYEIIETIDMGPVYALQTTGASLLQTIRIAMLPQLAGRFASDILYALEINVRASTVLGYLGAGGIGLDLQQSLDQFAYPQTAVIIIAIFVVVLIIDLISNLTRRHLQ